MGMFTGKKGLILGVANKQSIAWAIADFIMSEGGECGFTHLPDPPDAEKQKNRHRVHTLIKDRDEAKFLIPMDVQNDASIKEAMGEAEKNFGKIDFMLHSIAFALLDDLKGDSIETSREGFKLAMDISAYSFLAVCNAARSMFNENAAVAAMTYFGGERCVPGYNVMGICKAALDACVKYLAYDLGIQGVRVNALSAGPVRTLAGKGAGVDEMRDLYEQVAPLQRNITHDEVARTGAFLLSDLSNGVSGDILHVDGGYHAMGSPGRMLDRIKEAKG